MPVTGDAVCSTVVDAVPRHRGHDAKRGHGGIGRDSSPWRCRSLRRTDKSSSARSSRKSVGLTWRVVEHDHCRRVRRGRVASEPELDVSQNLPAWTTVAAMRWTGGNALLSISSRCSCLACRRPSFHAAQPPRAVPWPDLHGSRHPAVVAEGLEGLLRRPVTSRCAVERSLVGKGGSVSLGHGKSLSRLDGCAVRVMRQLKGAVDKPFANKGPPLSTCTRLGRLKRPRANCGHAGRG